MKILIGWVLGVITVIGYSALAMWVENHQVKRCSHCGREFDEEE